MKVDIITPFKMQWIDGFKAIFPESEVFENSGYIWSDKSIKLFMWCNGDTVGWVNSYGKEHKVIVFIRRYEFYTPYMKKMNWNNVDAVVMVNDYFAHYFERSTGVKPHIIYNGVAPEKWRFKKRKHGKKIAVVGFINQKKNYPLVMQILARLPKDYELHLAGGVQCEATMDYIDNFAKAVQRRVIYNGHIDNMDFWLEDKNYLLSTAISEGNPNNVIEAMAKGIKPIVHNWPGAREQFGDNVFNTVDEALALMSPESDYNSKGYRQEVETRFGWGNYEKIKELVVEVSSWM